MSRYYAVHHKLIQNCMSIILVNLKKKKKERKSKDKRKRSRLVSCPAVFLLAGLIRCIDLTVFL